MKVKWIFTLKVLMAQILFSIPLFSLIVIAMLSNKTVNLNDIQAADIVTLWIVWLSFPVIIVFVSLFVNKIFNHQKYPVWKQIFQTIIGFILGCFVAAVCFAQYSSPVGLIFFFILPIICGSLHFKSNKKEVFTTLNF